MITTSSARLGRRLVVVTAALAVALLSAACGGPSNASDSATLNVALSEEPPTLEPCQSSQSSTGRVVRGNVVEGLTRRDPVSGDVQPALATSWTQKGPDTWAFTLRSGVAFQNGTPLTPDAVAFSIKRSLDPKLACEVAGQFFGNATLTSTVTGPDAIEITTATPDPILPLKLSFIGIVPTTTDTSAKVNDPIGTGPYKVGEWNRGVSLTLNRFDGYWGTKPDFPTVRYVFRSDPTVRSTMVQNGEVDLALDLDPNTTAPNVEKYNTNQIPFLRLDPTKAPTSDIRVRQAISYAIDVGGMLQSVFQGSGKVASQLVPPSAIGYNDKLQPWPYDPEKAKQLVAEAKAAGTPVDAPITLIGRTGLYPNADKAMSVVQNALAGIGLNAKVQMLDVNAWLGYQRRPFSSATGPVILQSAHGNQGGDASFTMDNNYGSKGLVSSYGTPELDAMITKAEGASGQARQDDFAQALDYVQKEVRDVPLVQMGGVVGVSPRITYKPNESSGDEVDIADVHRAAGQ